MWQKVNFRKTKRFTTQFRTLYFFVTSYYILNHMEAVVRGLFAAPIYFPFIFLIFIMDQG